jgi:hypothetical protein
MAAVGTFRIQMRLQPNEDKEDAMIAIERMTQKIYPGKWAELEEIDKRFNEVEQKAGFPPKKRLQCVMGSLDQSMLIIERQWDSLAAMESTYEKVMADPAWQSLSKEVASIVQSSQIEVFTPLP